MTFKKSLGKLNKTELLSIIAKLKKDDLINIINKYSKQKGGGEGPIIKETKNSIRKEIVFNQSKLYASNSNDIMNDNNIYNDV